MSTKDNNDKRRRFRALAGGKADPNKSTKSREKRRSAGKPHIWVSRHGYGGTPARDRHIFLADLPDSVRTVLEKHLKRGDSDRGKARNKAEACCSFCTKKQDQVEKLIGGTTVYICNECVRRCVGVLERKVFGKANP